MCLISKILTPAANIHSPNQANQRPLTLITRIRSISGLTHERNQLPSIKSFTWYILQSIWYRYIPTHGLSVCQSICLFACLLSARYEYICSNIYTLYFSSAWMIDYFFLFSRFIQTFLFIHSFGYLYISQCRQQLLLFLPKEMSS